MMQSTLSEAAAVSAHDTGTPRPSANGDLPQDVVLSQGERILWTGRPRVRDPRDGAWLVSKLKALVWLMIPLALLLSAVGAGPEWAPRAHWAVGAFAVVWIAIGSYGLMIEPIHMARRRSRTLYVLTNIRAIVHVAGRRGSTRSVLLDTAETITLTPVGDGAVADLWVGGAPFERLADAAAAHAIALEAVRIAGTPAGGAFTPIRANDHTREI